MLVLSLIAIYIIGVPITLAVLDKLIWTEPGNLNPFPAGFWPIAIPVLLVYWGTVRIIDRLRGDYSFRDKLLKLEKKVKQDPRFNEALARGDYQEAMRIIDELEPPKPEFKKAFKEHAKTY